MTPTGDPPLCTCWMAQTTHVGVVGPCPAHGSSYLDAAGREVSPYVLVDLSDATREKMLAEIEKARLTPRTVLLVGSDESVRLMDSLRALDEARPYEGADAIRDLLASVPKIEEARPMNRAQRRAKMRRGGR